MGLLNDDSVIGFDYNFDGKIDKLDDLMYFTDFDEEERLKRKAEEEEDEEEIEDKLEEAGIDPDNLEDMDEDERREAPEDAGLDPDDFDEF